MMSAENSNSPLDGYAKVNSFLLDTYEMKCLGFSYNLMIKGECAVLQNEIFLRIGNVCDEAFGH